MTRAQTNAVQDPVVSREQKRSPLYIKVFGVYGFLTPGSYIPTQISTYGNGFKVNLRGLGGGLRVGAGIGYVLNDFINIGIDGDLLTGETLKTSTANTYPATTRASSYSYSEMSSNDIRVITLTPNITFKALSKSKYYIYSRLGISIGNVINYKTTYQSTVIYSTSLFGNSNFYSQAEHNYLKNTLAVGYQAAIGTQFKLTTNLRGFVEVVWINQSFKPKQKTLSINTTTVYPEPGSKPTVNSSTTTYNYALEGDYNKLSDGSYYTPSYNIAINSIGVSLGLALRL